jgi:hypothetical protein
VPQVDLAIPAFGYKNHIALDRADGLIRKWTATHAAAHDGFRAVLMETRHVRARKMPRVNANCTIGSPPEMVSLPSSPRSAGAKSRKRFTIFY